MNQKSLLSRERLASLQEILYFLDTITSLQGFPNPTNDEEKETFDLLTKLVNLNKERHQVIKALTEIF